MRSRCFRTCLMPLLLVFTGALSSCGGDEFVSDAPSPSQGGAAGADAAAGSSAGGSSGQAGASGGSAGADAGGGASGEAGSAGGPTGGAAGAGGAGQGGEAGSGTGGANTGGANTGGANTGGANTGGESTGGASTGGASTGGASTGGASTGGASTGGASTGGASTGGASGAPGEVSCMDKVDNENDGAADCADSECTGTHRCVDALPSGWLSIGYLNLSDPLAPCPTNFPGKLILKKIEALPSQPQACTCACANAGSICTSFAYCGASCTSSTTMDYTVGESCDSFGNGSGMACSFTPPAPKGGNCLPNFAVPALAWPDSARFCQRNPQEGYGSCPALAQACVPKAPPNELGPCILSSGDVQCPSNGMTRHVMGSGPVTDKRTCDCSCGDTIGGSCSGGNQVYLYSGNTCSSTDYQTIAADGKCVSIAAQFNAGMLSAYLNQSPTCAVNGTRNTKGEITYPKYTICCAP